MSEDVRVTNGRVWISLSLLGGIFAAALAGFGLVWTMKAELTETAISLRGLTVTVDKIDSKLDTAAAGLGSQSQVLAALQARLTALEAEIRRQDARVDGIESRVRANEQKK